MVVEHELHGVQLDEFAHTAVADGEVAEKLQRLADDALTAAPVLEIGDADNNNNNNNTKCTAVIHSNTRR